jgi:hypothetical protein
MRCSNRMVTSALVAVMALAIGMQPLAAQGKGKGADKRDDKGKGASRAAQPSMAKPGKGNSPMQLNAQRKETRADQRIERQIEHEFAGDVELRGKGKGRFARQVVVNDLRPSTRRFFDMNRAPARAAVGAVARAHLRGLDDDALVIVPVDDRVRILNRANAVLVDLDDERVRNLGRWDIIPLDDDVSDGAPAFCRSGEGHPVFGRQWCVDKRFGLGQRDDFRWGRTDRITDVVFLQPVTTGSLTRDALRSLLGPVALDRMALHAITLGLSDPLTGRWMVSQEPGAPRVLVVSSGKLPVAEVVDIDQDNRADMMVVALRDW